MSYDRQLDQVCPHYVVQETLFIDPDRRIVRPIRPIASSGSVSVRLDGAIEVPRSGVAKAGSVLAQRTGPYTIQQGVNDRVVFRVGNDADQTLVIPPAVKLPALRLADALNQTMSGASFYVSGNRLGIQTSAAGPGATVFVQATSTFLSGIGIPVGRQYKGLQIVPGWTLVRDPDSLDDRPRRMVVFNSPLRGFNDYVEINYNTIRQECRRCGGTGMEHDWRYAIDGEVVQVTDEALLIQEIQKLFYTIKGSNPFHGWYGTELLDAIGKKVTPNGFLQNLIVADMQTAFRRWQSIKRQQEAIGQTVSDREFPFALSNIALRQSTQDPTVIFVTVTVQNRTTGEGVVLERGLRFPQAPSLPNQSVGGSIRASLTDFALTR